MRHMINRIRCKQKIMVQLFIYHNTKVLILKIPFDNKRDADTVIIKATWSLASYIDNFFDSI